MLGLQPGPAQPQVFRRLPRGRRLSKSSLGGPAGLRSLALPSAEPRRSLSGAQPGVAPPMAVQPGSSGT
eukprot:11888989-Alexandrium_andersonii.AAC.1